MKHCTGNGLYYYGARYYDPRISRFLSVDRFAEFYPSLSAYSFDSTVNPWTPHSQGTILLPGSRTSSTINIFGKIIPATAPASYWDTFNHIPWRY